MSQSSRAGYDAAQIRESEDDLGRWRFANDIASLIRSTPAEWSARIGIFGKWGEGKSTVLLYIESILKKSEYITLWFNPWSVQDTNELWASFGSHLLDALSKANLAVEPQLKTQLRRLADSITSSGVAKLAEGAAEALGKEKLYSGVFGLITSWLTPDGPLINEIRNKLDGRRIVVFIDDLDRATPTILPQLLLSLRELLDLPGFTFLLAFDDEIVAKALAHANEAWGDGGSFLDKILDFKFRLPPVSQKAQNRLLAKAISRYCPFLPEDSTKDVGDLLPLNPRKLKSLVRGIASLQPQVARHDPSELSWTDIWLAQLISQESYPLLERLLEEGTIEHEIGQDYAIIRKMRDKRSEDDPNKSLRKLILDVGIQEVDRTERLLRIAEAARSRSSRQFRYCCELTIRPHAVSWKEFRLLLAKWKANSTRDLVTDWMSTQAIAVSAQEEDVENELFNSILIAREAKVSQAAEARTIDEHEQHCLEAQELYTLMEQFLGGSGRFSAPRFMDIYGKAKYWIGFRKNAADLKLRQQEETLLINLIASSPDDLSIALIEALKPWENRTFPSLDDAEVTILKDALLDKCMGLLRPLAEAQFASFLQEPGSIRRMDEPGRFQCYRYLLLNPDSLPRSATLKNGLLSLLDAARIEQDAYENATDLLYMLYRDGTNPAAPREGESIKRAIREDHLGATLWGPVSSRPFQWRMQIALVGYWQFLLDCGVSEGDLPLSPELQERAKETGGKRSEKGAGFVGVNSGPMLANQTGKEEDA